MDSQMSNDEDDFEHEDSCSCGNSFAVVVVNCTICGHGLCPACVISGDLPLCIFCKNDQLCLMNNKIEENKCSVEECDALGIIKTCSSKGCGMKGKFCLSHVPLCKFCKGKLCGNNTKHDKDSCIQHRGIYCFFCKEKRKHMHKCDICNNYCCKRCRFYHFEKRRISGVWEVCKSHTIVCSKHNLNRVCYGTYFPLPTNKCNFPDCSDHGCDCCTFLLPDGTEKYACERHVRICTVGTCCKNYAEHRYGLIKWRHSNYENVTCCFSCFAEIKCKIETLLLIFRRLDIILPKVMFERICRQSIF